MSNDTRHPRRSMAMMDELQRALARVRNIRAKCKHHERPLELHVASAETSLVEAERILRNRARLAYAEEDSR